MATPKAAWGMEIGADAVKAIRLEREGDAVAVTDFAVVAHKKVLTTPDLDQDEMIRLSLGQFISQKSLEGEHLVMSVPGHAAFARFAKLPPVEPKKVPDIVKFEAVQQIPFPIDEVEWDYQTFTSEDSPEIEVGIFAITRDRVQQRLGLYNELGIVPESLTLSPVALYNAMAYDLNLAGNTKPVIFLDIGTQATDVVIADDQRCWIRTFPLGGTHFTEAIANAFKLSYSKAEKLKKEASTSKYAKQIMQAMRPVFSDLLQDLQRSIGYYQSVHRDNELTTMVGIGSTFKIPGLRKFIGQQLQINVVRLDEFKRISVTGREAASFAENTVNMATAYGLALQGVGLAPIAANLVPVKALREQMWHSKTKWFAAAAAIIVVGAATTLIHPLKDQGRISGAEPRVVRNVLDRGKSVRDDFQKAQNEANVGFASENMRRLVDYRSIWPHLVHDAMSALAAADPQPELLDSDPAAIKELAPGRRRLVKLISLDGQYRPPDDVVNARRIFVTMYVEFSHRERIDFLNRTVATWLREHAEPDGNRSDVPYRIVNTTEMPISCNPGQLETIVIDDGGERRSGPRGGSRGSGSASPPPPPNAPSAPRPPSRQPPGSRGGGASAPSGVPSAGGGEGRRERPGSARKPPGARSGPGGLGAGSGATPSTPRGQAPGATPGGTRTPSSGSSSGAGPKSGSPGDLEAMAPLPAVPDLYPEGAEVYRVPITFEIEILDAEPYSSRGDGTAGGRDENGRTGG